MKKMKIAVVGLGAIGATHLFVASVLTNAELYAVCDMNEEVGMQAAKDYGVKYFATVEELAADTEVEAVVVCVPDKLHLPVGETLARAGKHILMEKPICPTVKEALQLKKTCGEAGVKLCVGQTTAFVAESIITGAKVQRGELGELSQVSFTHQCGYDIAQYINGRDSVMFYLGVHDVYSILEITGQKITSVYSKATRKVLDNSDDCVVTVFTLDNGAVGVLEVGWNLALAHKNDNLFYQICGTKGTVENQLMTTNSYLYTDEAIIPISSDLLYEDRGVWRGGMVDEQYSFIQYIQTGEAYHADIDLAIEAVKVIEGIFESARTGLPVVIE